MPRPRQRKLTNAIRRAEEDVATILNEQDSDRYLEGIVLMNSLLENVLKWLVYVKILWERSDHFMRDREVDVMRQFCNQQDFYSMLNLALVTGLIDHKLFNRIDEIRRERNDMFHQYYLFTHRKNQRVLRSKLVKLVGVAEDLFVIFNALIQELGFDETLDVF